MALNLPKIIDKFPFKTRLSLSLVEQQWQSIAKESQGLRKEFAHRVLDQMEERKALRGNIEDISVLEEHAALLEDLMSTVLPTFSARSQIIAVVPPYSTTSFYATKGYRELFPVDDIFSGLEHTYSDQEVVSMKSVHAYACILEKFYGYALDMRKSMVFPRENEDGELHFYQILIDNQFIEYVFVGDQLPELSEEDIIQLEENSYDLEVWEKYIDASQFEIQGFGLFQFIDVSEQELLAQIKVQLLEKDSIKREDRFLYMEHLLRNLLRVDSFKLGVAAFHRKHNQVINYGKNIHRSLLIPKTDGLNCSCSIADMYDELTMNPAPRFFSDIRKENPFGSLGNDLIKSGIVNVVAVPLLYNGQLVGMLEMASSKPRMITAAVSKMIEEVSPLFAMAVQRSMEELENKIQRVIKEEYTAIHNSVEWRFVESAIKLIEQESSGQTPEPDVISFEEVYPLYGASDVRGSSHERNKAIKGDLQEQLRIASKVLSQLHDSTDMPILSELEYRVNQFLKHLDTGLYSGDEFSIIEFLQSEVEPFYKDIVKDHNEYQNITNLYWKEIDKDLGFLYKRRKAYEKSLTILNEKIGNIVDREAERVQRMFPHYFEKYHTDGVEYNIYMGQSLSPHRTFNNTYLQNLRLWQLQMAVQIARESHRIRQSLPVPLELTHLILLQSTPLSIQFRQDEKQFDVDGAYNVRYEIVKKRIDKATIKGSTERLTQPDKIAIVYSYDKDLEEYYQYMEFLKGADMIEGEVEELELEDLQGVYGLKALRVSIKTDMEEIAISDEEGKEKVKA